MMPGYLSVGNKAVGYITVGGIPTVGGASRGDSFDLCAKLIQSPRGRASHRGGVSLTGASPTSSFPTGLSPIVLSPTVFPPTGGVPPTEIPITGSLPSTRNASLNWPVKLTRV
jgi:hypothetical protein